MRFLVAMLTATSTIEVVVGIPEPVWMLAWGATLIVASTVIARGRNKGATESPASAPDGLDPIQQPSFASQVKG